MTTEEGIEFTADGDGLSLMELIEFRRLAVGDRLLKPATETGLPRPNFAANRHTRHVLLWDAYLEAADYLAKACEQRAVSVEVFLPILNCYRQAVELALKWLLELHGGIQPAELADLRHNLVKLWRRCEPLLVSPGDTADTDIQIARRLIEELHQLDATATAFRYPSDKNGELISLPDGEFDIENLRRVMKSLLGFFTGCDGFLSEYGTAFPLTPLAKKLVASKSWANAAKISAWRIKRDALQAEMDAITSEGLSYMDENGGALPPPDLQERLNAAHAAWIIVGRRMPLANGDR